MTKDQYFEMCEALNSEPKESEIPVEFSDLPMEVQEAIQIYSMLQDSWEPMNGTFLGKNYSGFGEILNIMDIAQEDRRFIYEIIRRIDNIRKTSYSNKAKSKAKSPSK